MQSVKRESLLGRIVRAFRPAASVSTSERVQDRLQGADEATIEVDPARLGEVTPSYAPTPDGQPDPGEVVWTWVPYEENDGRGKDRPVVIVAATGVDRFIAVQLTSKPHSSKDYLQLGTGSWDPEGRPSWALLDRVFLVHAEGVRREGSSLDKRRYDDLVRALRQRYVWR